MFGYPENAPGAVLTAALHAAGHGNGSAGKHSGQRAYIHCHRGAQGPGRLRARQLCGGLAGWPPIHPSDCAPALIAATGSLLAAYSAAAPQQATLEQCLCLVAAPTIWDGGFRLHKVEPIASLAAGNRTAMQSLE